jgi:predicted nucleotidyltransferase
MRLSETQRAVLRQRLLQELGPGAEVRVFGTRLDDAARGGDLDLLVRCPQPVERKAWLAARLTAVAQRVLGGRKVDVLLVDPTTSLEPVHRQALRDGVLL